MIKQIYRFLNPRFQNLFLEHKVNLSPRYGYSQPAHQELYKIINSNRNKYKELLYKTLSLKESIWSIQTKNSENDRDKPTWKNKYLPGLDIIGIYTLLTELRPKRYFEIGSGYSTKLAYKIKNEQRLTTEITSLDPFPRTGIDHLVDKIIREPLEDIELNIFDELCENDILFIDNSHRILPNSDSTVFFS